MGSTLKVGAGVPATRSTARNARPSMNFPPKHLGFSTVMATCGTWFLLECECAVRKRLVALACLFVITGAGVAWFLLRKEKKVSDLPIGIGDEEAQKRFLNQNVALLNECTKLYALLEKVFIRRLVSARAEHQVEDIGEGLQLTADEETAVQDRRMAEAVVFFLGRAAADDFGELLILCGNGRGIGAYKILRSMYERVVTAAFIAKNPPEARIFLSHSYIERQKLGNRLKTLMPDIKDERTPEQVKEFEDEYKEAKARLKDTVCSKCDQPVTQEAWTRRSLETMAEKADENLARCYAYCYLVPTLHLHATPLGLESRMRMTEAGFSFKETSEPEARKALLYGHGLVLRLLKHQNNYFGLGLDAEIDSHWAEFPKIWKAEPSEEHPVSPVNGL
jgi:hypothetical protein